MGTAMQHLRTLQMDKYNRQNAMTDEFRSSEIGRLNDSITSIQNNPMLSEDEKSGKIQAARSQILGMYTPALGKKRVAQLQQQYGLTPAAPQQGTVPAQPSTQFTAPPLQGESLGIPADDGQGGTESVPLGAPGGTFPTIDLPGKQAQPISNTPATVSDTLAAGHKQQYIPVTLANGTTMMLPQNLAGHLITTQESNAGKRGIAELKADSTESIANANRDSHESIANANRDSHEKIAGTNKLGSLSDFVSRVAKDAGVNPEDISAESMQGIVQAYKSAPGKVTQSHYFYTDANGAVHDVPITRKTLPTQTAIPKLGPAAQPPLGNAPQAPMAPPAAPITSGGLKAKAKKVATPAAPIAPPVGAPTPTGAQAPTGVPNQGRIIGQKESAADKDVRKSMMKRVDTVAPMANIDQTQADYIKSNVFTPRQDLGLIVAAVRAMNPGTVRLPQQELEMEIKAGSWGDRFRRQFEVASTGLLPPDQRSDLFNVVHSETSHAAKNAFNEWKQRLPNQAPPGWMMQYGNQPDVAIGPAKFTVGNENYTIPREHVEEFLADHPDARRVQ
jgi:hypothetical protein